MKIRKHTLVLFTFFKPSAFKTYLLGRHSKKKAVGRKDVWLLNVAFVTAGEQSTNDPTPLTSKGSLSSNHACRHYDVVLSWSHPVIYMLPRVSGEFGACPF